MQHVRTLPEGASAAGACLTKVHTLHLSIMLKIPAGYVLVYRGGPTLSCACVTLPTFFSFGVPEPFATPAAF